MTARIDAPRQLKNCRAGAATNIEYALARLGAPPNPTIPSSGRRPHDPFAHIGGPGPRGGAVPKFDLRRVSCLGLMVCHRGPTGVIEIGSLASPWRSARMPCRRRTRPDNRLEPQNVPINGEPRRRDAERADAPLSLEIPCGRGGCVCGANHSRAEHESPPVAGRRFCRGIRNTVVQLFRNLSDRHLAQPQAARSQDSERSTAPPVR